MNSEWRKVFDLKLVELALLLFVIVIFPFVVAYLKKRGFQQTQLLLSRLFIALPQIKMCDTDEATLLFCQRISRIVNAGATNGFITAICLPRSLLLWWLLRWRDIETELCIGVDNEHADFNAHAWVEYQGTVINDELDIRSRYSAFDLAGVP